MERLLTSTLLAVVLAFGAAPGSYAQDSCSDFGMIDADDEEELDEWDLDDDDLLEDKEFLADNFLF